ncbi:Gag-Pro-Pol polyprotein [Amphibalanus amphitrite]|uniref:Gag-Pro-Pol polyprotein n=1 Tax=Amphibalanus amphitrite TaxID=1232801 RepID=A0A6A4VXY7_AMPAM|nr:Gag-Pro-Pol polyprotein [Amphibalanus amphitrite]KAF0309890.1 Gag-Pro-Pol polyprotein [Amphibalanus amphitrite]
MIDCGPSRFAIWKRLIRQDARSMIQQLELVFLERGAPKELLIDNYPAFRASAFCEFAERWGIKIIFRCAHSPSGNGITERCHRTVKTIVARSGCSVMEAVNLYNITPKDDVDAGSAPANMVYSYEVRVRGIGGDDEQSPGQYSSAEELWEEQKMTQSHSMDMCGTQTVQTKQKWKRTVSRKTRTLKQIGTED